MPKLTMKQRWALQAMHDDLFLRANQGLDKIEEPARPSLNRLFPGSKPKAKPDLAERMANPAPPPVFTKPPRPTFPNESAEERLDRLYHPEDYPDQDG